MINLTMDELISRLVNQKKYATPAELVSIANHVAAAPFAVDLLEVDAPLWGSFWQFDVMAPGYRLPASELALLRAIRLDKDWPDDTTVAQFLTNLRQAILHPRAGIWSLSVTGQPCIVFATPPAQTKNLKSITVVWYCASTGQIHAGYRTSVSALPFDDSAITQRQLVSIHPHLTDRKETPGWLVTVVQQLDLNEESSLAARIDAEILRWRLGD